MSAIGHQPLPRAVVAFCVLVRGVEYPQDVADVLRVVGEARAAPKPRARLNRSLGQLRRQRPGLFGRVLGWLQEPAVQERAKGSGAAWVWHAWCRACAAMEQGAVAHAAFGMDKGGCPPSPGFSHHEDAAIYAEYLHQVRGVPSAKASERAIELTQPPEGLDLREHQRHRAKVRALDPNQIELEEQSEFIRQKYRPQNGRFPPLVA